jgi:hypothetical protein
MRGSDLRSVNRKSMYSMFAPLDPNERLPRELLDEGPPPRRMSLLASTYDQPGRKELAAVIWLPAVVLILGSGASRLAERPNDDWRARSTRDRPDRSRAQQRQIQSAPVIIETLRKAVITAANGCGCCAVSGRKLLCALAVGEG